MAAIMTQYMDPDVANILLKSWEGQPLTILDTTVMEGYLWPLLLTLQDDFIDNREGVYSNERWQSRVRLLDVMLASSAVRTWWGSLKVTFTPEFQTFVDRRLVKLPQTTVKGSEMMMENEPVPTIE